MKKSMQNKQKNINKIRPFAWPLALTAAALGAAFFVCLYFADDIFGFLVRPLTEAFPKHRLGPKGDVAKVN